MSNILCQKWRLNNLYRIVNKDGISIPFRLNFVQETVLDNIHNRNLLLKARQMGMSTFAVLYLLDECIFNKTFSAGIVSYSLEHAQHIFKKIIGHALDTFPKELKPFIGIVGQSAREITFTNGSSLRVDTTLRGGAYQLVLVSEFGKTCARSPVKAEEVITGTLNALPANGKAIIESTGEGLEGYFAEMCMDAYNNPKDTYSSLEYKLFFFPWYQEPTYKMDDYIQRDPFINDYFRELEKQVDYKFSEGQMNWYATQYKLLGEKVRQEYPSTVAEAFLSSSDAYYYAEYIEKAYKENRCLSTSLYDALAPVYVSMDIGVNDLTVIIFFQLCHGEIRVLDYYEDKNKGLDFYSQYLLNDKKYIYHTIFLPHDSKKRDPLDTTNTYERDMKKYFSHTQTRIHVLTKQDKNISISHSKLKFDRCVFNVSKTKNLLDHLSKYRKKWSEQTGRYLDEPFHDIHSNYADSFRYLCQGVDHIEAFSTLKGSLEKHRKATEKRNSVIF